MTNNSIKGFCQYLSFSVTFSLKFSFSFWNKVPDNDKNAVPFNIPNNDRSFQADSKKMSNNLFRKFLEMSKKFHLIFIRVKVPQRIRRDTWRDRGGYTAGNHSERTIDRGRGGSENILPGVSGLVKIHTRLNCDSYAVKP